MKPMEEDREKRQGALDTEHIVRTYFHLALPVVVGSIITIVYSLADTYFIAQTGNALLVAGVSVCAPLFTVLMAFGNIFGQGGSSLISRLLGRKETETVRHISSFCFYIALLTGTVVGGGMLLFRDPLLGALGASSDTLPYAAEYATVLLAGAPLIVANFIHMNLLRCEGMAGLSMAGTVIGSVHAIRQHRLSRLIAYSSVAQIACVYLGISIGGTEGIAAALFYILAHSAAKSMLFLTAHKLRQVSGGADGLEDLRGAANRNRLAGLAFLTGACSLTGIPGLGGFAAKLYLAQAGIVRGGWRMPVLLGLLALSTVLNVAYMLRSSLILYSREDKKTTESPPRHDPMFAGTMIVQIGLNLFLGLCGNTVMELLRSGLALFI
jgi:formate hydrogenlyase subunit 3/multisubunit Na+/H+ antiporter MnhD subunit